eukprot:5307713-Amphidinium_carterae.1
MAIVKGHSERGEASALQKRLGTNRTTAETWHQLVTPNLALNGVTQRPWHVFSRRVLLPVSVIVPPPNRMQNPPN